MDCLFRKLHEEAIEPSLKSAGAAGYDLYALEDGVIEPNCRKLVRTGIAIAIPNKNIYARIAPRSSLSLEGVDVGAGVIDSDYRGEIKVLLINSEGVYHFKKGVRIAQLIFEQITHLNMIQVANLPESERGTGGFGSTGK